MPPLTRWRVSPQLRRDLPWVIGLVLLAAVVTLAALWLIVQSSSQVGQ